MEQDIFIEFSVEELLALGDVLGVQALPGIDDPFGDVGTETQEMLLDAARRSLSERGVLSIGAEGGIEVVAGVADLLDVFAAPGLWAEVLCQRPDGLERVVFVAQPDLAVGLFFDEERMCRLLPFAPQELVTRILEVCGVQAEGGGATGAGFSVPAGDLAWCGALVPAGDRAAAVAVLTAAGVDEDAAARFVIALAEARASYTVTVLHRVGDHQVTGGELSWIDSGGFGLWLVPVPDVPLSEPARADPFGADPSGDGSDSGGDLPATVTPATGADLAGELRSYLPVGLPVEVEA